MAEWGKRAELGGITDKNVEMPVALVKRRCQFVDLDEVAEIERHQRRRPAGGLDLIVDFLEATGCARRQYKMRAFGGETLGDRGADAARSARNQRDLAGEAAWHQADETASRSGARARRPIAISAIMLSAAVPIR